MSREAANNFCVFRVILPRRGGCLRVSMSRKAAKKINVFFFVFFDSLAEKFEVFSIFLAAQAAKQRNF